MIEFYPNKVVDNVSGWYWISSDHGAWELPKNDWESSHKSKIE